MLTSKLLRNYNTQEGVTNEFPSAIQASIEFRDAMKAAGYIKGRNRTWSKPGCPVIMQPKG